MALAYPFLAGYLLDLLLGDPKDWPHPVRWMGRLCQILEKLLYRPSVWAGGLFWLITMGIMMALSTAVLASLSYMHPLLLLGVETYLIYACLATRSLHRETQSVEEALVRGDLSEARKRLSLIVGRETAHLSQEEVRRAVIETIAENLSDGVVAPITYGLLLGVPGMVLYKGVNTLDSMVGYRNERYLAFGRVAARLDDAFNYLPARLTALLMVLVAPFVGLDGANAWWILRRDAKNASSPNAGWPEAAMAGALGVRVGGPSRYFGQWVEKPFIGDPTHPFTNEDYRRALRILYGTSFLMAAVAFIFLAWSGVRVWGLFGLLVW